MNWILYRGDWFKIFALHLKNEYELILPGGKCTYILSRAALSKELRRYYGLKYS